MYFVHILQIIKKIVKIRITILLLKILHLLVREKILEVNNLKIKICRDVFSPFYTFSSELLAYAAHSQVKSSDLVLDLGTGSGFLALIVSRKARFTVASDISIRAAHCALENLKRNMLQLFCDVVACDLTSAFRDKAFSLVIFNPPYLEGTPRNELEKAFFGGPKIVKEFFIDAGRILKKDGRILLAYSTLGPVSSLFLEAKRNGWVFTRISEKRTLWETLTTYKFTRDFKN